MKKFKILISFYLILLFLNSCGTIKKGFENPKKNSSDEFLVQKKSPLVIPPEFNELPVPNQNNATDQKQDNSIKNLITENNNGDSEQEKSNGDLEGSILSKIKNK
jgi:PBP1b-binding outer membrane lipoprotein LpoB